VLNKRNPLIVICLVFAIVVLLLPGCSNGQAATTLSSTTSTPAATPFTSSQVPTSRPATISPSNTTRTSIPATTANAARVSVSAIPSASTIKAGDNFDVVINVSTEVPSRQFQCILRWDPAKLQCNTVEQGGFYKDFAKAHTMSVFLSPDPLKADNEIGKFPPGDDPVGTKLSIAGVAFLGGKAADGSLLGVTGTGSVFVLHMTARAGSSGTAAFTLSEVKVNDNSSPPANLDAEINNCQVSIQ
jgi:hypothetical protein